MSQCGCGGVAIGSGHKAWGGGNTTMGKRFGCGQMGCHFGVLDVAFGGVCVVVHFGCRCGRVTLDGCGQRAFGSTTTMLALGSTTTIGGEGRAFQFSPA